MGYGTRTMPGRGDAAGGATPSVGPRRTEKLSEVLAREIVRDLRDLQPATMLPPEAVMLEKYRVGRASLREALRLLEVQGLIVIRPGPGGGPMVAQADSVHYGRTSSLYYHMLGATYHDVVAARAVIEPALARVVAEKQDPITWPPSRRSSRSRRRTRPSRGPTRTTSATSPSPRDSTPCSPASPATWC